MKRTPLKRKKGLNKTSKKDTLSYWKKEFWSVFSKYIRLRDKGICITCGLERDWKKMQAGHCIPRAAGGLSLYFDERNVNCQCYRCNINLGGFGAVYREKIIEKYGQEVIDEIMYLYHKGYKVYTIEEYKSLIQEYKLRILKDFNIEI